MSDFYTYHLPHVETSSNFIHEDAMSQNQTSKEERRKGETSADIQHAKRIKQPLRNMRCNIQKVLGQTVSCSYPSRIKQRGGEFLQEFSSRR